MAIKRVWYPDKLGKIGIVEKATNAITKDGYTSDWKSITEVKSVRIYAISRDDDIAKDNLTGTWTQIPVQFHEIVVAKAISNGYKDPRNINPDGFKLFEAEYMMGLRDAKKFARSDYISVGSIKPFDY